MSETNLAITLALGIAGFFLGRYLSQLKQKGEYSLLKAQLDQEQNTGRRHHEDLLTLQREKEQVQEQLIRTQANNDHLTAKLSDQKKELEHIQERFTSEFENLAQKILDAKSEKFTKQNKESLNHVLKPLQEKIEQFEKRVESTHKDNIDYHASLRQQIIGLTQLNEQMSREATNLTKALKGDSKLQGNWGELVLERVLEKSGLEKDREYYVQQSFTTDTGQRVLPDVVLHLPEGKKMIIDSKVSLTAYERFVNAEDQNEQGQQLKEHVGSLKKHVEQLGAKNYHDLYDIESPDFVLLFVPIEPAFAVALNHDNSLYNWAFEKNIVIVTPTTLLATLRTIDSMWTNEKQQQNAIEIATHAGRLYDAFVRLSDDLLKVGEQMDRAKGTYADAMNKLSEGKGNLVGRVERLKKLGAKASKQQNEKLLKRATDHDLLDQ
ncbi:MAG: DNA recombination protein RmuC [Flavobacteriaceae bacterium]|jgi:DNA recombination protein RmuC|nr:DNA recombination protein RmuC [Flavobacteriaceae bacterium]MDG1064116.1 DNA recombination protein RmuC [Flavobacteriaceae bacterium]MDG1961795.1 DNA recombination protein RmuC [Flavobacteriaceae bacterium]